jgi:hypothetical protein
VVHRTYVGRLPPVPDDRPPRHRWRELVSHARRVVVELPFAVVRAWAYFVLGFALIIDAIVQAGANTTELVVALILLGLIPTEPILAAVASRITSE